MEPFKKDISYSEAEYFRVGGEIKDQKTLEKILSNSEQNFIGIGNEEIEVLREDDKIYLMLDEQVKLGNRQSSYNLTTDFFNKFNEKIFFEVDIGNIPEDNESDRVYTREYVKEFKEEEGVLLDFNDYPGGNRANDRVYILEEGYKFKLGPNILNLIGKDFYDNDKNQFILSYPTSGKKHPQFHCKVYDTLSKKGNEGCKWFVDLYDKNVAKDEIVFYLKDKLFIFDIKTKNYLPQFDSWQRNRIFFGAPGTGKSFKLNEEKNKLLKGVEQNYERVTFHPDYSYANFVGTYKPKPDIGDDGKEIITYKYVQGPFIRLLIKALNNPSEPYLLIIEEINRANVAAVFGDIFQLLDRDVNHQSEYPINVSEELKEHLEEDLNDKSKSNHLIIPPNMFIWATMNSADQGVFFMDTAFKRRWNFTHVDINNEQEKIENKVFKLENERIYWNSLRKAINTYLLSENINEDKCLGPFFISSVVKQEGNELDDDFLDLFKNKVLMYLFEDAARSKRDFLFEGSKDEDDFTYSKICKDFNTKGIKIFNPAIVSKTKVEKIENNDINEVNSTDENDEE